MITNGEASETDRYSEKLDDQETENDEATNFQSSSVHVLIKDRNLLLKGEIIAL